MAEANLLDSVTHLLELPSKRVWSDYDEEADEDSEDDD